MNRITIAGLEPVEVDIFGTVFSTVPQTRSRQIQADALRDQLAGLDDSTFENAADGADRAIELLCQLADTMLAPEGGKRRKASTVLLEHWKSDKLTFPQLHTLLDDVGEAISRPT